MHSEKWLKYYFDVAERTAQLSKARRLKVGTILVLDKRIIAVGYNGLPSGWEGACETLNDKGGYITMASLIHSEENLLMFCLRTGIDIRGSFLVCTHSPCVHCSKLIFNSGIKEVWYKHRYDTATSKGTEGLELLKQAGVEVHQYSGE